MAVLEGDVVLEGGDSKRAVRSEATRYSHIPENQYWKDIYREFERYFLTVGCCQLAEGIGSPTEYNRVVGKCFHGLHQWVTAPSS